MCDTQNSTTAVREPHPARLNNVNMTGVPILQKANNYSQIKLKQELNEGIPMERV